MLKKIFLIFCLTIFFSQPVHAAHQWVWGNGTINVYVEDSAVVWNEKFDECKVKVFDVIEGQNKFNTGEFYFYQREGEWFYYIVGQKNEVPVTHQNSSGYILDFVKKYLPKQNESDFYEQ